MGIVLFGSRSGSTTCRTLPSDFYPKTAVASVAGLGGTAAAIASILYNWGTGRVVDIVGYTPVFVVAGLLGPIGFAAVTVLAGRIAAVSIRPVVGRPVNFAAHR
jgi:ACS family hexuronate transporter-like MFS transporter